MGAVSDHKNPLTPYYLFDGFRVLSQMYILFFHYMALIFCDNPDVPYPIRYVMSFLVRIVFVFFFAISGISTAKWFQQNAKKSSSMSWLTLRFFFDRVVMIVPFYYLFLFSYYLFLLVINNQTILSNFSDSLVSNLLFISNFYSTEKITIIWNWSYSVLLQLVIITPPIMFALRRNISFGLFVVFCINFWFICRNFVAFYSKLFTIEIAMNDFIITKDAIYSSPPLEDSYFTVFHVKPFTHGAAYINGLVAGILLEGDYLQKIQKDLVLKEVISNVHKSIKLIVQVLSLIMLFRGVLYPLLPLLSAVEASLFSSLLSFLFCHFLLDNRPDPIIRDILTLSLWKRLRKCLRVSYLLHPVTFMIITRYFPIGQLSLLTTAIHCIITFAITYSVSLVIHEHVEKHVLKAGARVSKWIFST